MEKVLKGVPATACVVYLDDILVHAPSFALALANQQLVLGRISGANLRLNPAKCQLLKRETSFLATSWGGMGLPLIQNQSKSFILNTDASNVGIGGVLSQLMEDWEKVIAYFSCTLNKAELLCDMLLPSLEESGGQTAAIACIAAAVIEDLLPSQQQQAQTEDPEVSLVIQWVQEGRRPPPHPCLLSLRVPRRWWHSGTACWHFGVNNTQHRLWQQFYWGQCRQDVESYCHRCDACMAKKGLAGQS
ncbi:hypothetical protein SKAU_G00208290 [Synaphobranchus kaupii]|uniref:Gypsy retrotransposon integrase-like protein 1 n=1 Tax=Synaphobranchus kaupii TaxID=118154 RepID=A0A9Q1F8I9_SYNKA|nr:hypothetical protein SKAU_G00208290 [Synaphobranchus kaupii]